VSSKKLKQDGIFFLFPRIQFFLWLNATGYEKVIYTENIGSAEI
jgi:hypothetical protein